MAERDYIDRAQETNMTTLPNLSTWHRVPIGATIPAGLLNTGSSVRWAYQRGGNPATDKHVRAYFGGAQVGVADTFNTTPFAERGITMRVLNSTWGCCPNLDNSNASGQQFTAINTAVDNVVALTMQLTAPQLFGVVFGHEIYWR